MSGRMRLRAVVTDGRLAAVGTLVLLVGGAVVAARTLDVGRAVDAVVRADRWLLAVAVGLYAVTCSPRWASDTGGGFSPHSSS